MKAKLELTLAARRMAEQSGILPRLQALVPHPTWMRGDIVELATGAGSLRFVVHSRLYRVGADGSWSLTITLDHPAR